MEKAQMEDNPSIYRITLLALFAWVLGSTVLGRAFTAISPGGGDAQLFAYMGQKWAEGYIPYLDIWDNKPPGIFFVTALVFTLAPKSFTALAVVESIFIMGCVGTVYAIMRHFRAPLASTTLATAACATVSNLTYLNQGGNLTEIYVLWPAALSVLMFAKALPRLGTRQMLAAGLFAGIATSFKLVGLAPLLAQLVFLVLGYSLGNWPFRIMLYSVAAAFSGFLLAWLPYIVYFAWYDGALELIKVSFVYPFLYGAESQRAYYAIPFLLADRLRPLASLVLPCFVGILLLAPHAYKTLSNTRSELDLETPGKWVGGWAVLIALWLCFDILGALAGGRFYPHYFLAIAASLPVMVGIGYWHLVERPASRTENGFSVKLFVACAVLSSPVLTQFLDIDRLQRAGDKARYERSIIEYLETHKEEDSTLFTWNYAPWIYFETGLLSPHKLTSAINLRDSHYMRKSFTESLLTTLEKERPTYIVDRELGISKGALALVHRRFRILLKENYEFVKGDGKMRLYKIRSSISEAGG